MSYSRGLDTFSGVGGGNSFKLFYLPSVKGSTLNEKNLLLREAKSVLLEHILFFLSRQFSEGIRRTRKQSGSHKTLSPLS